MSRNKSLAVPMKATKAKPKKPLVLQDLNDDCLMEIMSHMSLKDILKMVSVNRRFLAIAPLKAVAKKCHSLRMGYDIRGYDKDLLHDFLKAWATKCGSLELVHFDESTLRTYLFSLQNLTELSLNNISLSVQNVQRMPRKLKSLTLDNCNFEETYDSETWWFECLSPTLNQLTIKSTTVKGLEELMNLTHFHIETRCRWTQRSISYESWFCGDKDEEVEMIKEMLDNNQNTLTSLNIHKGYKSDDFQLGELKYLQTLSVELFTGASLPVISCVDLVTLTIRFYQSDDFWDFNPVNDFLAALNCGKSLQKLTLDFDFIVDVDLSDFENLRHLELRGGRLIPDLRHQNKLETLIVDNLNFRYWDEFYNMELPFESLRTLILREVMVTRDMEISRTEEKFDHQVQCARRWLEDQVPSTCKWEFSVSRKEKKFQFCS